MSEPKTGLSKRFAIEIDTGKTKTVTSFDRRGRKKGTNEKPIVKRFPPDRSKSLRTQTTYNKDDKTGRITAPNVNVYQEITEEQFNALPQNVKDDENRSFSETIRARGARTVYYARIAELPSGGQREYKLDDDVINAIYDEEDAKLLDKEAGKYKNNEGQFKTISRVANESVLKNEGLNTNKPDSKNQLGLGKDGPTDVVDEDKNPLTAPKPFRTPQQSGQRKAYDNVKYPSDLRSEIQDVIKFTQLEYGPRSFASVTLENSNLLREPITGFRERLLPTISGSVTLPIQSPISDQNAVNWGSDEMGPLRAFAASRLMDPSLTLGNIGEKVNAVFDEVSLLAKSNIGEGDLSAALRAYFVQNAIQSQNLFSRATGAILNPNVELLFRAPQLRPFNFSFFLTARDRDDTKAVKQIIRFFKQGMSVKNTASDIFLRAPNVFKIEYLHKGGTHNGLNLIKECALTNFNVEYTPANTYSTFEDGTMTAYRISLQFTELEPVTEKDYKDKNDKTIDLPDNVIGY